jgi:flagellar hook protein FlgE
MYSGISGMKNFQTKLDVIGNNIANVNTYGFKKGRVTFKDTMNQMVSGASAATDNRGGKNATQVGLGSTLATVDTIHSGASLQTTGRSLDLGIDGDGYFVVSQGGANMYTRAGNFYLDDSGLLVNADGLKVQAFKYDEAGNLTNEYGDVAINVNAVLPAIPTELIAFSENLSADAIDGSVYSQQIKVVDDKGISSPVTIYFKKSADNQWGITINENPTDVDITTLSSYRQLTFTDGTVTSPTSPFPITTMRIPTGRIDNSLTQEDESTLTTLNNVNLDFSNLTQVEGSTTALINPDGNTEGKLESYNIGSLGEINGVYSNGEIVTLGKLAMAKFSNSSGLTKSANNLFQESINSGTPDINVAGEGRGTLASGSLEMSNVDLSEEFTDMIVAQRGFQANTRIITTSDEILQELVNLKR